jgi:hypothetical protein
MLEWRPEQLPVGSVVIIMGERRTEPHARLLVDLVSRMHERYDECVVFTADAGYWVGTGVLVTADPRDFAALLVPGPPRLVVLDHDDMLARPPRDVLSRRDLTLIVARVRSSDFGAHAVVVYLDPWCSRMDEATRERLAEAGCMLVVTPTSWSTHRVDPDPPLPIWEPWTTVDLRAKRPRALPEGETPLALDVVARVVARHLPERDADVAATCRQWRRAVDDVPRLVDVRRSGRRAGHIARRHGVAWDGRLRPPPV